jgi:hypothetical protein
MRRAFRRSYLLITAALASGFALSCTDAPPMSPSGDRAAGGAAASFAISPERPFGGTCTFASTLLPPEPGQPPNVVRFHQDEVCHLTHLGLTTGSTEETATFTPTGSVFVITVTYTAANGDQLFTTQSGTATPPDQNGVIHFSGTETVTGGTGRFADASGSFSFAGTVTPATRTGQTEFISGTLSY